MRVRSDSSSIFSGIVRVWIAEAKGRLLLAAWASTFFGVTVHAIMVRRRAKALQVARVESKSDAQVKSATDAKSSSPFRRIFVLAVPSCYSRPVMWAAALSVSISLKLAVSIRTSSEIGALGSLLAKRDWEKLYRRQLTYAIYAVPAAFSAALTKYASAQMALSMRINLMREINVRYERSQSLPLACAAAEDGVQMGTADVSTYCVQCVTFCESVFKPSVELFLLSAKLSSMMGVKQLLQCYSFFLIFGSWTRMVGPSFATMSVAVAAADSELFSHRSRLHVHAEEISMLRGNVLERQLMDSAAAIVSARTAHLHLQRFASEALDNYVLRYVGILAAFTAMMPAVFTCDASASTAAADPTQYFLTCLHLLVNVGMALKDLVLSHKMAATTRGLATRVDTLISALESTASPPVCGDCSNASRTHAAIIHDESGQAGLPLQLRLCGVSIETPCGAKLVSHLDLDICAGQRVLVCGPNGSGKSSLLRVLTGVWPEKAGEIKWYVPLTNRLVLPQRPYLLPQGTLKQNLLYPASPKSEPVTWSTSDEDLMDALKRVGMAYLAANPAELDVAGTCDSLSPGEQQRISLARLLIRRPAVALLDEPCAAVDPAFESEFFEECARSQMTLIAVSHRREISQYFTHKLALDGNGGVSITDLSLTTQ